MNRNLRDGFTVENLSIFVDSSCSKQGRSVMNLLMMAFLAVFMGGNVFAQTSTTITDVAGLNGMTATGNYIIEGDIDASSFNSSITTFSGTLEANINPSTKMPYRIKNLSAPLFTTLSGTVKNLVLEDVIISGNSGNTGAIACNANGAARIYNVGILSGSVGGTAYTGGLVGYLDGTARVVNCYSYATITGGSDVGGIVGYNNQTTTAANMKTMVMNCIFYGDITGGTTVSPVYGGQNINNLATGGLNTFNYYTYEKLQSKAITNYNCAIAVEEKYLNRFEFYRLLLNSNKKLAAFYVTGSANDANIILKWVLEMADRTIDNPMPYPVLKEQGCYPSIINPDIANAPDSTAVGPNKGGKLGRNLSITISSPSGWTNAPEGVKLLDANGNEISSSRTFDLIRTDKDLERFNFNYDKVQLPYYNDYGTKNYTSNKVVTGWKIIAITEVANDPYTSANYNYSKTYASNPEYFDYPNYNFADRRSSNKDLYTVSGRVFPQGGYFDVPYGVTEITIEPYWGNAVYLADANYDVVYKNDFSGRTNVSQTGTQVGNNTQFNNQPVKSKMSDAVTALSENTTVYDQAIVLVGNVHQNDVPSNGTKAFTIMSVDEDKDHEPDYSLIYHHYQRQGVCPIRFDFLSMPGTSQAQKPNGNTSLRNYTIFKTRGWFEVTNTAFYYSNQIEYENIESITRVKAPLILLGGIFDQFVSTQKVDVPGHTIYIHLGGNLWVQSLGIGTHGDGNKATPHVPVSVTGGDYLEFYLTGTYNQNATIQNDDAECYISGGRFGELAGACQEQIGNNNNDNTTKGNVRWQIYHADIRDFFGGGINDARPVKGNITTDIVNSRVSTFCGGPKFGDMPSGKKVTTYAEGCVFGKYFGAGYGGLSYAKKKYFDATTFNFNDLQRYYINDRGKYFDGRTTSSGSGAGGSYGYKGPGVATDFDYEFFVWSSGVTGARFYVKFASFSLAKCNDVESTLKNCTVNENFYGGGSLGKVTGTVTSELDGTIVKGNVFGAGFSATLPPIEVRDSGFASDGEGGYLIPKYNSASGLFEPGVFSGTTTFEWEQVDSYPSNGGAGFIHGNHVMTTQDLSKTNLGSVSGDIFLTIKGSSTVGGSVFGGGDESAVNGNTLVKVLDKTKVFGNIYGGGNMGAIGGNTKVIINGVTE